MVIRPATALNDTNKPQKIKKALHFNPLSGNSALLTIHTWSLSLNRSKILIFKIELIDKSG
jgi:hypothetical protein